MFIFGLGASSSALLKCLVDQVKFFYAWDARSDDACEVINDITEVGLYGSTMVCVYGFLWVRQWMFYHNPAVKNLIYRKHLIRFSRYLPIVIMTLLLVLSVFHLIPIKYRADDGVGIYYLGCVAVYDIANTHEALPIFFYIALTSTFQLSLLGLFLYPLVRRKIDAYRMGRVACPSPSPSHHSRRSSAFRSSQFDVYKADGRSISRDSFLAPPGQPPQGAASPPASINGEKKQHGQKNLGLHAAKLYAPYRSLKGRLFGRRFSESKDGPGVSASSRRKSELRVNTSTHMLSKRMQQSVIRAVMWTTMCIISDVTMVTVALLFGVGTPLLLISTMNNFNIVVNQLCLIATYSKWREILFPICGPTSKRNQSQLGFAKGSYAPNVSDISPGLKRAAETRFDNGSRLNPSPYKFTFDNISTHTNSQESHQPSSAPESPKSSTHATIRKKRASI
uniref:Uncharacterized protein LOC100177146 n=1 Tax=Phallusia mammillata TaxID=59560 RepID=A0A6F9DG29_9ASCI|nr:uncharacterized protein LOC100177146 [Phallusia mammillata]